MLISIQNLAIRHLKGANERLVATQWKIGATPNLQVAIPQLVPRQTETSCPLLPTVILCRNSQHVIPCLSPFRSIVVQLCFRPPLGFPCFPFFSSTSPTFLDVSYLHFLQTALGHWENIPRPFNIMQLWKCDLKCGQIMQIFNLCSSIFPSSSPL